MLSLAQIAYYIAGLLVLANLKSIPLSWHAQFYYYLIKHLVVKRNVKAESVFDSKDFYTHAPLMECDMNMHKSNATYFLDLDIARTDLMLQIFKDFFLHYRVHKKSWPYVPIGSVATVFKREIAPYQRYKIRSRVLGWDHKWLFVISRFEYLDKANTLAAVALSKYVFKLKRKTIPPEEAIEICGFHDEKQMIRGRMDFAYAKGLLDIEASDLIKI